MYYGKNNIFQLCNVHVIPSRIWFDHQPCPVLLLSDIIVCVPIQYLKHKSCGVVLLFSEHFRVVLRPLWGGIKTIYFELLRPLYCSF